MKFPQQYTGGAQGFSLVEMLVVVMILGIISIGLFQTMVTSRDTYEQQKITLEMQQNARAALQSLADDFRHVSYGKDPTQPSIVHADTDSITFVADIIPAIPGAEVISYSLSQGGDPDTPNPYDTILMKSVADTAGNVIYVEPQSYGIKQGGLSLRYFNGAGVEFTTTPLPSPELVGEVLIEVTAMEPREHKREGTYLEQTLSTTIYPRNLPLTPARSRPSIPTMGSMSMPNCESVTINWSTPTTNTDGSPLALDDISHFTIWFGTDPGAMTMYSRVARTINQWTITGLAGGTTYYFGVTCTSRSGVESYMQIVSYSLTSGNVPETVLNPNWYVNPWGAGMRIEWDAVTHFTSGDPITTTVDYHLYRGTTSGFVPDSTTLLQVIHGQTWAVDSTMAGCADYYFVVSASACGNEGTPSTEFSISNPMVPACVPAVTAELTETSGEIDVSWMLPTQRIDGSALPTDEISGSRVYYSKYAYTYSTYTDVSGLDTSLVISGLETCTTYYVNVACFDDCPQLGNVCTGNEFSIDTSVPCDPGAPTPVPYVLVRGLDQRIDLSWPANQDDCDLAAYKVYYGTEVGGPYNGTGALQGSSPISFEPAGITGVDDTCRVSLTGLQTCQEYAVVVSAVDGCDPPNESSVSSEGTAQTECMACTINNGCLAYCTEGPGADDVRFEIYSDTGTENLAALIPTWSGPGLVTQVWAGRPLVQVWNSDGSTGGNGAIGPQSSGAELDVDDFVVSPQAAEDGLPCRLVFDQDMNGSTLMVDFIGDGGGTCGGESRAVRQGLAYEDYDDGDISAWSLINGTWFVDDGELVQSSSSTAYALYPGSYTDLVIETKIQILSGATPYLLFRGDVGSGNFYMLGLKHSSQIIRLCKYQNGSFYTTQQTNVTLNAGTWHMLRVEVRGSTVTAYFDCNQILEVTDAAMLSSGEIGFRTYASPCRFDDFRVYTWVPG